MYYPSTWCTSMSPIFPTKYIAGAPLTSLVKPGGGIHLIVVGTVWRRLVSKAWYLVDGTIVGDTLVVDPRSRLEGVFSPNISRPLHGVKLLSGPVIVNFDFSSELVMKRVSKTIGLMDVVAKINDPQCELLLLRACTGISKLYFAMRTCHPCFFESAQWSFDVALRSAQERISVSLQTKLLRHAGIVASWPTFDGALWPYEIFKRRITLSDWLRAFSISGLGQTMNASSRVFAGDIYEDHVVSCAGVISIKHRHNVVCDTLVDICFRLWISVDIGAGCLNVCVELTGSLLLTQTGMADFVPEEGAVTLLKRIRKFSMVQDIGARAAVYIFNRINFAAIAKGV
nr:hypothetical protein [Tanacetum cinerariifolium]